MLSSKEKDELKYDDINVDQAFMMQPVNVTCFFCENVFESEEYE